MSSLNKVFIIGRVGRDPQVREAGSGKVAGFSVATSRKYKDSQGQLQEETEWHSIVCFGHSAEFSEKWIRKGDEVFVEGALKTRQWKDKEGNDRRAQEIIAGNVQKLSWEKSQQTSQAPSGYQDRQAKPTYEDDSDVPF